MIKRLKYHEINFEKYTSCIENSVQKNSYANKETLDFLCENWELLVWEDYRAVMPIPVKKKLGFNFVLMPLFCQQLGIFSNEKNAEIENEFHQFLLKNYKVVFYAYNHLNQIEKTERKKNYFISKTEYALLRKGYFKGRKSTLKTAQYLEFKEISFQQNKDFIRTNFKGLDKTSDVAKLMEYLKLLDKLGKLRVFGSYFENSITNAALVIDEQETFSLLGLVNDEEFKKHNGASFLIDRILNENIHQKSFDFMGGSIRGIEVFFKSFGSQLQEYPVVARSKKDLLLKFFTKQ